MCLVWIADILSDVLGQEAWRAPQISEADRTLRLPPTSSQEWLWLEVVLEIVLEFVLEVVLEVVLEFVLEVVLKVVLEIVLEVVLEFVL